LVVPLPIAHHRWSTLAVDCDVQDCHRT